jgi:hypothetical protein
MVPEGWSEEPLGKRNEIRHGFAFSSKYFNTTGDGYRLLTPGHFFEEGGFREISEKQKFYAGLFIKQKKSLMQNLLTGEVRVKLPDGMA